MADDDALDKYLNDMRERFAVDPEFIRSSNMTQHFSKVLLDDHRRLVIKSIVIKLSEDNQLVVEFADADGLAWREVGRVREFLPGQTLTLTDLERAFEVRIS